MKFQIMKVSSHETVPGAPQIPPSVVTSTKLHKDKESIAYYSSIHQTWYNGGTGGQLSFLARSPGISYSYRLNLMVMYLA